MTAEVELALIGLATLCVNVWVAYHQGRLANNVYKIEIATNSMKDALVATTKVASYSQGLADGKAQTEALTKPQGGNIPPP